MEEPLKGFHDSWHHTSKTTQESATVSALSSSPGLPTLGPLSRSSVTSDVISFKTPPLITQLEQLVFPPVFNSHFVWSYLASSNYHHLNCVCVYVFSIVFCALLF